MTLDIPEGDEKEGDKEKYRDHGEWPTLSDAQPVNWVAI